MTVELSKREVDYVDNMVGRIISGVISKDSSSMNNEYFTLLAQSAYRSALTLLEVRKEYVVEKVEETVHIDNLGKWEVIAPEELKEEAVVVKEVKTKKAKVKTEAKTNTKAKRGRPRKKKSEPTVAPLAEIFDETSA